MTDCVEGATDRRECLNATTATVDRRQHLMNVLEGMPDDVQERARHRLNAGESRVEVWKLRAGAAVGACGFAVDDVRAFPDRRPSCTDLQHDLKRTVPTATRRTVGRWTCVGRRQRTKAGATLPRECKTRRETRNPWAEDR